MTAFTVFSVQKQEREPVIQGKTFHSYLLEVTGHEGKVQMLQNPSTPAPTFGQVIEGTIEAGKEKDDGTKWPDRLKRAGQAGQGSGGGSNWSPEKDARITRQHSQHMAILWLQYYAGVTPVGLDELKKAIDWFDADVASVASVVSKPPVEPPKAERPAVPSIPLDRAKSILDAAVEAGLAEGTELKPALVAKLTEVGVETGKIGHLNVDQAEVVEAFIAKERYLRPLLRASYGGSD